MPRLATERLDSGESRLDKVVDLIRDSRYSIHDLSRLKSSHPGELARLNMPFELGVDYGMTQCGADTATSKSLLVIAEDKYLYQAALSDIAGWDIRAHGGDFREAIKQTRAWLRSHGLANRPSSQIIRDYFDFQGWDFERLFHDGWSKDDITKRETGELLEGMMTWLAAGRPATFS